MTGAPSGPLVVLHDHLDGGIRPATLAELAVEAGVDLPCGTVDELAHWLTITPGMAFAEAFSRFDLVVAATQTAPALRRLAREAVEDLAADGVIHAELRFAPLLHTQGELDADDVMAAVHAGLDDAAGSGCEARLIVCAMREQPPDVTVEAARVAARWRDGRVVGFDLAGGEVGHPAGGHREGFAVAGEAGLGRTVHAGEMDGVHQVRSALDHCAPDRIGHGWRLIDDCDVVDGRIVALGATAAEVRDRGIPLEICLTSNACLGLPVPEHPVRLLLDAGFAVTLHPDDRAITTTTARREFALATEHHRFTRVEAASCASRAAAAAFLPDDQREALVDRVERGWDVRPDRLVHLAERGVWEAARGGPYLPPEWSRDGFVHLSALHQVLTPANRFYRGRDDLVAVVLDAHLLGRAVVWEAGTGTVERFPHLYSAVPPDAVLAEIPFPCGPDGGFLLPPGLVRATRSPLRP